VRILLDQNLSPKLIRSLADILPGLESVYDHALLGASDPVIFEWTRKSGFEALLSADHDFVHLAERFGPPPKVIRIERCDFPSKIVEQLIRREAIRLHDFLASNRAVLLLKL
jgi:predicted nuclease of predicted toxin-antitoxin system